MGYFFAVSAAVLWGLAYALDQKILQHISTPLFIFMSSLLALILVIPFLIASPGDIKSLTTLDKTTMKFLGVSLVASFFAGFMILLAIQNIGASRAAIFEISYPFFVVLFSIFLYQAQVNAYFIIGSIFLFIGSFIIITKG